MEENNQSVFRKKTLERISSPEQLTDYLRVTNPGIWVILIAVIILMTGVFVWSCVGTLETKSPANVIVKDHVAEVAVMDGTGKIELTGSLGDVMQESAKAAITCIRSHAKLLGVDPDFYKNKDIHIHAPEGAVPKDGPSAGITMATAIYSALSSTPVRHDVAMTGEITLRGKVLAIGGLKEKSMAAFKNGIDTVFIPKQNGRYISDFDQVIKDKINFIAVENFTEVISGATAH